MTLAAFLVAGGGLALLVIAALGLHVLPDALTRQHAATKSVTLALGLVLAGVGLYAGDAGTWVRILVIVALLVATLPVASHMLARAAVASRNRPEELAAAPRYRSSSPTSTGPTR